MIRDDRRKKKSPELACLAADQTGRGAGDSRAVICCLALSYYPKGQKSNHD
jgi:hypothetical protein